MVLWQGSMWCTTSVQGALVALPSFTLRELRIPKRRWSEPMAWSLMGGASGWIIPLPYVPIPPHQESTWADQLTMGGVVAAGGGETHTMTAVAMTVTTDTTIDIVAGALHRLTTVDTGLAHGLAPTAHGDTRLLLPAFSFPSIIGE